MVSRELCEGPQYEIRFGLDFRLVSEDTIKFCHNTMVNFYDKNVFPYENI